MGKGRCVINRWHGLFAAGLLLIFCVYPLAGRAVGIDPWLHWQTLESPHFRITFPEGKETLARHALAVAESVRAKLDPRFDWDPAGKVELVLSDYMDLPNGATTALPYNHIELFISPPDRPDYTLEDFDDWLTLLITHEYTHVLQLDKASGAPRVLRYIFGRFPLWFPGNFQPSMFLEGLAVYDETDSSLGVGRGQGAQFAMLMRAEVDHGVRPYDQVAMSGVTKWPAGTIPYLYGVNFYQFVAQKYGEHAIFDLVQNYSHQVFPFLVNMNVDHVLGSNIRDVWSQFGDYLHAKYQATPGVKPGEVLVQGERLTQSGYQTRSPVAADDGSVFFIRDDAYRAPAVMRWKSGVITHVADIFGTPGRLGWNAHAGLLLARPEICDDYDYYFDLYRIDPADGDVTRLTHCARYHNAAWSPDGTQIAASQLDGAQSSLVLLDANGKLLNTLWQADDDTILGALDWSPDDKSVAASLWRHGRGWGIELFDLKTRSWHVLVLQKDASEPRFTPDGKAVLFTSAAGGVFNLRRIDLSGSGLVTLTRVRTGAFSPVQAADGDLFYIGYSAAGYDLHRLPAADALAEPSAAEDMTNRTVRAPVTPVETSALQDYSPWSTLRPRYWFPELAAGPDQFLAGVTTSGQDSLGIHNYAADIYHEFQHNLTGGTLVYDYSDRFQFALGRGFDFYNTSDNKSLQRIRRNDKAEFTFSYPLLYRLEHAFVATLGLHREQDTDVYDNQVLIPPPTLQPGYDETVAGLRLLWASAHRWPVSVSLNDGRTVQLIAETGRGFPGDYPGNAYRLNWNEYLRTGDESTLMLRYTEGYTTPDAQAYSLGGTSDSGVGTLLQDFVFGQRGFALRGYPSGKFSGHRMRIEGAAWAFPISHPEHSFTTVPFGLHQLSAQVFVERGGAWDQGGAPSRYYNSVGAEVDADLNLAYIINFNLAVGVAHGMSVGGEDQVYARLSLPY
ncbi:MAG: hypothetical protein ACRETO_06840 [Gammaproteobacteria bacterium]